MACCSPAERRFHRCATDVHYGLIHCVNEGEETEVDSDTCADPGPPDYVCVQGYGRCTDGTVYYTANAGCSDACGDCGGGGVGCPLISARAETVPAVRNAATRCAAVPPVPRSSCTFRLTADIIETGRFMMALSLVFLIREGGLAHWTYCILLMCLLSNAMTPEVKP